MVLAVILFVGVIRVRLLAIPLTRDEGEYAYAGQLILQGVPPYELAYNMKLPGTYCANALGMAVFGQTITGVHLTLLLVNSLTIVFIFLLGRKLFGNVAGVVAGMSYAVMSLSPVVGGLAAEANHFVVLFAVPGAFTPTCDAKHLPGFVQLADQFKAKGVNTIACFAVNDVFVMAAWGKHSNVGDKVLMLADGNGDYARALGLAMDGRGFGMGERSQRFAIIVDDGVASKVFVEAGGEFKVSAAEHVLAAL